MIEELTQPMVHEAGLEIHLPVREEMTRTHKNKKP
jgi:hypothetical protein